ncbi:MAG: HAMP domain-containing protein [Opitutus sp.]|nr:HAMP domain-containing protein [Opitutus sp.]
MAESLVAFQAGGVVLLTAFSATLYIYVAGTMARPLDHQLRLDLTEIRQRLNIEATDRLQWDGKALPAAGTWKSDDPWFELWDEQGRLVRRCWPFYDGNVDQPPVAPARGRDTISVFNAARDVRLRVLSVPFSIPDQSVPWMIRVITIHQPNADALGALRWIIFIALPAVIALLVVGGYAITLRWLSPLERMVASAEQISAENLGRRLPVENAVDEFGRIATVFNFTLDRLESSFVALDRFAADASHELRTPLTTLRSVGEVGLRRSRTVEEYREIIGSMLEEAQRLQLLVQRLLELASAEAGPSVTQRSYVRLDQFVTSCVGELGILAEYRGQRLALDTTECSVMTDPVIFRQALQNLVDNALKYSPDGAEIRVEVRDAGMSCEISVTDQGPGIPEEHRVHLAERFYRPDTARGRSKGGFGLGLSLTKAYMRVLSGSLEYSPAQPHGSTFRLTLPKL